MPTISHSCLLMRHVPCLSGVCMINLTSSDASPARTAIWNLDGPEVRWNWKFASCKYNRFSFEGASSPSPGVLIAEGLHDDRIQLKAADIPKSELDNSLNGVVNLAGRLNAEGRVVSTLANHQIECTHRRGSGSEIG